MDILIGGRAPITFEPTTEAEEVAQNVRTILNTSRMSVPLDRAFGVAGDMLDMPIPRAKALFHQNIVDALAKYESRAEVTSIRFDQTDAVAGRILPQLTIRLRAEV